MEFILQLMADLFLPDDMGKQDINDTLNEEVEKVVEGEKNEAVEGENIFGLVEFH